MSKLCKKRVHRNDKKNSPWDFKKVPQVASFYTTNGGAYPSILKNACGKEESSFVSETIRMSMLSFTILDNISNLFVMELMFICRITILFILFIWICFKISNGPSSQLLLIVLKVSVGFIGFKSKQGKPLALSLCDLTGRIILS